jgi:hypothetical protein
MYIKFSLNEILFQAILIFILGVIWGITFFNEAEYCNAFFGIIYFIDVIYLLTKKTTNE